MGLIRINRSPSRRQLQVFGITWLIVFGLLGWLLWSRTGSRLGAAVVWLLSAGVPLAGCFVPGLLRAVYLGMAYAAMPIGVAVSFVLLAAVYYLVLTPIGLVMRLCGRDPMRRGFPSGESTHWLPRRGIDDVRRYFRQF